MGDATRRQVRQLANLGRHGSAKVNGRRTTLPMGDYRLELSVLKALGDPSTPAHWETWTPPVISIVGSRN